MSLEVICVRRMGARVWHQAAWRGGHRIWPAMMVSAVWREVVTAVMASLGFRPGLQQDRLLNRRRAEL